MGIFDFFLKKETHSATQENSSIRKIIEKLENLPPQEAKYLAAFAYLLGRVAHADLDISQEETQKMEEIVGHLTNMEPDQAILVVQIAKSQNVLFGGTENYLVTREFKQMSDLAQRENLLHCLFSVAGADENISGVEESEVRQISDQLGFTPQEFLNIRLKYRDQLAVLKNLPRSM